MMKSSLCSLLYGAALLLSDALATYHLSAGDPQLMAAQSYAQTRNNGRPPLRTLNPSSKSYKIPEVFFSHFSLVTFSGVELAVDLLSYFRYFKSFLRLRVKIK